MMLKVIWSFALLGLVCSENVTESEKKLTQVGIKDDSALNKTEQKITEIDKTKTSDVKTEPKTEKSGTHVDPINTLLEKESKDDTSYGSEQNPINPMATPQFGESYFTYAFLTICSLSVVAVIVVKTHRMKQSRAELKYGKTIGSDRSEIEPLGSSKNKWLEESSDDDENEIFDINFLKNTRTNGMHQV